MKTFGIPVVFLLIAVVALTSCQPGDGNAGPTEEEIAAMVAEEKRLAKEKREREREENRQRIMEELRQKDLAKEREKARLAAEALEGGEKTAEPIEWEKVEEKMVARMRAIGTEWDSVRTQSGEVYRDVVVKDAYATGLSLVHGSGKVEVTYEDLPATLQAIFLFDADEAENPLPKLSSAQMRDIRDRLAEEKHRTAEEESGGALAESGDSEGGGEDWFDDGDSTLLAQRRRLANRLNAEVHKLTKMQDAGMSDGHAVVQKQKQLIANAERALKKAEAAVMAERRRRIGG